jgi:hypothetical protein
MSRLFIKLNIIFVYLFFALIAISVNLISQEIIISYFKGNYAIYYGIAFGTFTGFWTKFFLDKNFIFYGKKARFIFYVLTALITTSIFWSFELFFEYFFNSKLMRYFGALIGLSLGYLTKYILDKEYAFF